MIGEVEIEASTKQEAEAVALSWRKKLIHKGDCLIDDRTLLLFVASFGIPADFPIEYMMNLIIQSHPSETVQALRNSRFLVPILPDVIEKMIERELYFEAVDIIKTFGIDEASLKIRRDGVFMELVDHMIHIPKVLDEAKQRQKVLDEAKQRQKVLDEAKQKRKRRRRRKRKSLPRYVQENLHHQMLVDHCLCTWPPFE